MHNQAIARRHRRPSKFRREQFDREREFVAARSFVCTGRSFSPGDPFDKTLVSTRRLRQLYDTRRIHHAEGSAPNTVSIPRIATIPNTAERDKMRGVPIPAEWTSLQWTKGDPSLKSLGSRFKANIGRSVKTRTDAEEAILTEIMLRSKGL